MIRSTLHAVLLALAILPFGFYGEADAAVIYVTSLDDTVGAGHGCTLKEAIYAANLDESVALVTDPTLLSPTYVNTQCAPGNGADIIVLPTGDTPAVFPIYLPLKDLNNSTGPIAMPAITSVITIQGNGATVQPQFCTINMLQNCTLGVGRLFVVNSTGNLTLLDLHIKGFQAQGGSTDGDGGGGGGLGAGGAIYVRGGQLNVQNSTFEGNSAIGGNGTGLVLVKGGGGGGGMFGGGSKPDSGLSNNLGDQLHGGGGGGGSLTPGSYDSGDTETGGGSGGGLAYSAPGSANYGICGGVGGAGAGLAPEAGQNGQDGICPGGGGGGGGFGLLGSGNGGNGNYGGGGGGGASGGGNGGNGGFGGGGGSGWTGNFGGTRGGTGGFGGGGGSAANGGIVGSGHPGAGGKFGGNANSLNGGGGGALGGAIFNDSGSLVVLNSTFTGNFVDRGVGGNFGNPGAADNGADAGAAIFSYNGSTFLQHVTISGNESTGPLGGVYIYQDPNGAVQPTYFSLYNSIIANNGGNLTAPDECTVDGPSITMSASGNLVLDNNNCGGVVSGAGPALGPLQNNGGLTPTMAITSASPAFNAADPAYELSTDQRGTARPQDGLPDIGAYEACVGGRFGLTPCQGGVIEQPPPTELLTIQASPATGGTTDPAPGLHSIVQGTVLLIHAVPTPGNTFLGWTGAVTDPTNPDTTIIMNQPQNVTAQFTNLTTTMAGNITDKSGPSNSRDWTLSLEDNGPAGAAGVTIPSFTLTQTGGAACSPVVNTTFPLTLGTLMASQTETASVVIDFSSCAAAARFTATFTYSANYGTVTGSVVRTNQFQ